MTITQIKSLVCTWLNTNNLGPAIVSPTSTPAPSGKYIAVRDLGVDQFGAPIKAKPGSVADTNDTSFMQVADIVMTEVEGEGVKSATGCSCPRSGHGLKVRGSRFGTSVPS